MASTGSGGRHRNSEKVIFSGVTSMIVKPFFSVGRNASCMATDSAGVVSMLRKAEGKPMSPVPSVPVMMACTGCANSSSAERDIAPTADA